MSTPESNQRPTSEDPVAALAAARERVTATRDRVEQIGEDELEQLRDAYDSFVGLLDRYEERVVGDEGDFETIVEFQSQLEATINQIHEDVLLYETFEEADERLQQRYFSTGDFEAVREQFDPVADLVARLDDHEDACAAYRDQRQAIERQVRELRRQIDELDRLVRLGTADLDAPTDRLRAPIETYNQAVERAFEEYVRQTPARAVLDWVETTRQYPLVEYPPIPSALAEYVAEQPSGTKPVPELLEYAEYSRSKLDHYVANPGQFIHAISRRQRYLATIDATPLRIGWPPPPAGVLTYRCRELTAVVNRFAPAVVEQLRAVTALPRGTGYDRLRESVLARTNLTDEERNRIASEDLESKLAAARDRRQRLQAALAEFPSL